MAEKLRQRDPTIKNDVVGVKAVDWLLTHSQKQRTPSGFKEMQCVCVCVCVHAHTYGVYAHCVGTHTCMHVETRGQCQCLSLQFLSTLSLSPTLEFIHSAGSGWMVTSRVHLSSAPSTGVTYVHPSQSLHGCYGAELRSSCFHSRNFAG